MKKAHVYRDKLLSLLKKYRSGKASAEEKKFIEEYYHSFDKEEGVYDLFSDEEKQSIEKNILERIHHQIEATPKTPVVSFIQKIIPIASVAAIFLLIIGGALFFYSSNRHNANSAVSQKQMVNNVQPGHNGAVLHLSDGRTIVLDNANNGTLAMQGDVQVIKENGELKYIGKSKEVLYNDVVTNKGRQWQLVLPDGTKVWLNAASSIHYPLVFSGKERRVEITGEAYFEVVHNAAQPFIVKAGNQIIEDIGTAFNVNAYEDEPSARTTLTEGAVKVNNTLLKPGQQYNNGLVHKVNTEEVMAWKNGYFEFNHSDIRTIMKQLARWYDLEIVYDDEIDGKLYSGKIGRNLQLNDLLDGLSFSDIHYHIEGHKMIIKK
jgi:hypothetical protein